MNREDIIKMALEARWGNLVSMPHVEALERFATIVAAAEREACKKAADEQWVKDPRISGGDAIRARGQA